MAEFKIGDYTYRTEPLDALTQFHVMRRMAPVLGSFKNMEGLIDQDPTTETVEDRRLSTIIGIIEPLANSVASMKDDDANYVFRACLSVCTRCEGDAVPGKSWSVIWQPQAMRPMYKDIDMPTMLRIVYNVMMESFAGFFPAPRSGLSVVAGAA